MVGRKLKAGIAIMMALVVGMPAAASACDVSRGVPNGWFPARIY